MSAEADRKRVIVLTPTQSESASFATLLADQGVTAHCAADMEELCREVDRGVGAALITDDVLTAENEERLLTTLERATSTSSDPPLVILSNDGGSNHRYHAATAQINAVASVAFLERSPAEQTLVSAVKFALHTHAQQFALREEITDLERIEDQLDLATSTLGEIVSDQTATLRLLRDVATAANSAESIEEALTFAVAQICHHAGWSAGQAYLPLVEDPNTLVLVDAFHEKVPGRFDKFRRAARATPLQHNQGLPGRVYATGRPEWLSQIGQDLHERHIDPASGAGVATAAAFPIVARTDVVGVLEFFGNEHAEPDPDLLTAMSSIGTLLGRVVERDRAERALLESVNLIHKISETSPTMIRILDVRRQRYLYFNERTARFFGVSPDEAAEGSGLQFRDAIHPDDWERYREAKTLVRQPGRAQPVTWQGRLRNAVGEWRWLRSWSVVFTRTDDGDAKEVLSISIDVTDLIAAEERLRQTERLTSIGTLAAGIAHEINNPLASVIMTGQLLRRRALDTEVHEMLDGLISDAKRCAHIVRNVQQFARQEPSDRLPLSVNSVIQASEELSRQQVERAGVKVTLELASDSPRVLGDATGLEQVVLNLIMNAIDACGEGGKITLRTETLDGRVRISVQDNGHGMPPEVVRHVFDPFYTTRSRQGGAGLGLSIAHGIIEDHGGAIDVKSDLGVGTTVHVLLPAIAQQARSSDNPGES